MPRRGHTEEQILQPLRQAEGGEKVAEICRKLLGGRIVHTGKDIGAALRGHERRG